MNEEIINELKYIDGLMLKMMFEKRPEPSLTIEQAAEVWTKTAWHMVIMDRIKELSEQKIIIT